MPRRGRKSARSFFNIRSVFGIIKVGSFIAPAAIRYNELEGQNTLQRIGNTLLTYGGMENDGQTFKWENISRMWGPYVVTTLISTGVQKLNGILRKL